MGAVRVGVFLSAATAALFAILITQHEHLYRLAVPVPDRHKELAFQDETWTLDSKPDDQSIRPFRIEFSEEDLNDLKRRLANTKYSTPLPGVNWTYGIPADQLKQVVDYWLNTYNWPEQQHYLNGYKHYKTQIEGLDIHFMRSAPEVPPHTKVYPIFLVHGWPGSFFELIKLVPHLNIPRALGDRTVAFDVIIPSLPGYGFSDAAQKPGLNAHHTARIFAKLAKRLKLERYFLHGGDWGSMVCRTWALMYPERVLGLDLTMYPIPMEYSVMKNLVALLSPSLAGISDVEKGSLFFSKFTFLMRESGYMHLQATKPDTVGAALQDSPAGLAAYILEKFSTWTNPANVDKPNGGLLEYFNIDDLLTNVMIYWISGSITSSQRFYKEYAFASKSDHIPVEVPTLLSSFKNELLHPPDSFVNPYYTKLVKISHHETGGYFAGFERPKELAEDIWELASAVLLNMSTTAA